MQSCRESSNKLQELKTELETWRAQQTVRKHIPKHLWDKAYQLLDTYPVGVISRELRLDHNKLRKHLLSSNKIAHKSSKPQAFLELSVSNLANSVSATSDNSESIILPQTTPSCRIVFERGDGSRLTLHLSTDWSKIESICNGFLRG